MADKEIVNLATAASVGDDILIPCYVPGSVDPAQKVSGAQIKEAVKPVKGTDYWTGEEMAEILNEVLKEIETVDIIPEQELAFVVNDAGMYTHSLTDAEGKAEFESRVQTGGTYYMEWDGVLYEVTAQEATISGVTAMTLGNLSLGDSDKADTGEPFIMVEGIMGGDPIIGTYDASASHVVRLYQKGSAAVSPVVEMSKVDGVTTLNITDANGTHTTTILDGEKGEKGETGAQGEKGADGYTPVRGTDYWTAEDQAAIVADVLAALPVAEGGSF